MTSPANVPTGAPSLPLILARELAAEPRRRRCSSSTPTGMLVFYNEAAELLLGKPFAEMGEITAGEFGAMLELATPDGDAAAPARLARRASRSSSGGPRTRCCWPRRSTASRREVEATAYPLLRRDRRACTASSRCSGRREPTDADELMQARVWGCRGSLAAPGADTVRYGGNTSCVEVRLDSGHALVLDAGTGMRPLGVAMRTDLAASELHILLTHLHLDHLQGLGFFRPLFRPDLDVHIWGPASPVQRLAERIAIYLSPPLFPVRLADIPSRPHVPRRARGAGHDRLGDGARRAR